MESVSRGPRKRILQREVVGKIYGIPRKRKKTAENLEKRAETPAVV